MNEQRLRELMEQVGLPNSLSLRLSMEQLVNEVEQETLRKNPAYKGWMDEESTKYNGFSNYETWLAYSWLTDDAESAGDWHLKSKELTILDLSLMLKKSVQESVDDSVSDYGLLRDLLKGSIDRIDFKEIAEHISNDFDPGL